MDIYSSLLNEYNKGKEERDSGKSVDTLELMFIGYALDTVDMAKEKFKVELDFSEASLESVEKILDHLNKTISTAKPSPDLILSYAKAFTGYIGQVIKIKWGGKWKKEDEYSIKNGPGLFVKNQDLFLLSKVYRRIVNGSEDNIWHFYQAVKKSIEGCNDLKEVKIEELKVKEKKNWFKRIFNLY